MSSWQQKRELEALKQRDPAAYSKCVVFEFKTLIEKRTSRRACFISSHLRLMSARSSALATMGKFDDGLSELRSELLANPVQQFNLHASLTAAQDKMKSLNAAFASGDVSEDEHEEVH